MSTHINTVIGVFADHQAAEDAVRQLGDSGFPITQVSIVASDLQTTETVQGYITTGDVAKGGAKTGAWVGGIFGLLTGAAFIWVPGFGPLIAAGSLAAALIGGLEGAAGGAGIGALVGALAGLGISKNKALKYSEDVRVGKYLLLAHGTEEQIGKAKQVLETCDCETMEEHDGAQAHERLDDSTTVASHAAHMHHESAEQRQPTTEAAPNRQA